MDIKDYDNPFKVEETRFWSVKTIPKFLLIGLPRFIFLLVVYIIVIILILFFNDRNINFQNQVAKWTIRTHLYFFGYKNIDIDPKSQELISKSKAQIIVCNHSSYIDSLLMVYLFPEAKIISSEFVSKIPVLKKLGDNRCLYLKNDFTGNLTGLIEEALAKGERIIFFSNGVCCRGDYLLKLRNGAFVPRKNILPIYVDYPEKDYWIMGEHDMMIHAMCLASNRTNKVSVKALPDYELVNEDMEGDIEIFKENFRRYYAKGFGVKLSQKSYKDHPFYKIKNPES